MEKKFALNPAEQEKECAHEHVPFSGAIPNTGVRRCTMCGMTDSEIMRERLGSHPEWSHQ